MEEKQPEMMAVSGLDCGTCEIRLAPTDAEAAEVVVDWFKKMGWLEEGEGIAEVIERGMVCTGCRGDRSSHWSPDCPPLVCCVDEKGLEHCAQCEDFACEKLEAFAEESKSHQEAVEQLRRIAATG